MPYVPYAKIDDDNDDDDETCTPISSNGKLLKAVIDEYNLKIVNFHDKAVGKWTRIQPMKDGSTKRSMLDYFLLEDEIYQKVTTMLIDEDKIHCPYRTRKRANKKTITFSDHCAIKMSMEVDIGELTDSYTKKKVWNFTKEGYVKYMEESINELNIQGFLNPTTLYGNWTRQFEKLLHKCFLKKTVTEGTDTRSFISSKKCRNMRGVLSKIAKQGKIQRRVVKRYLGKIIEVESKQAAALRATTLKQTMADLSYKEKFSPIGYWRMKKAADKKLKNRVEMNSILKENGVEVSGETAVLEAYKEEFKHRLRSREPAKGWEEYVQETNKMIRTWLGGNCRSSPPFSMEELKAVIKALKKGKSPGVDTYPAELFIYAGEGVLKSLLEIFNWIKESGETPEQWDVMKIVTIYKQKGNKKMLKYYRGIFLALAVSKIFEGLIKKRIEDNLHKVNILQAGSRTNRGPPDNVFLLRACADHYKHTRTPLYITAYDYEQAFDSLWVEDCIMALSDVGVSKEMLKLIYSMNKKAKVTVQTPYGVTDEFETEPIVKQGTVLGSILCSTSTAEYCGESVGVTLGSLAISSLLYVDDIIDMTTSTWDCMSSHEKALLFTLRKKLLMSGTKCYNMIMNAKEENQPIEMVIDEIKKVLPVEEIVYLGDVFNSKGNNDGLIKDRIRRGTKAMICIISLLLETDLGVHKISVGLLLYQSLFISTMLFNSQTWSNIREKDGEQLRILQSKFLKKMVGVSSSTCSSFTFLELGVLPIIYEIHKRQLMYLYRITQLETDDPVYQASVFLRSQNELGEKNWWTGINKILEKYSINKTTEEIKEMGKDAYRAHVNASVEKVAFEELVAECTSKKKTSNTIYSSLKTQPYLTELYPSQAKILFKCRSGTLDIKSNLTYKYDDLLCRKCGIEDETVQHIVNCGYNDFIEFKYQGELLLDDNEEDLKRGVQRINKFIEEVS